MSLLQFDDLLCKDKNATGSVSTDDDVLGRMRFDYGADGGELITPEVEVVASLGVEDVDLARLTHRTHHEHVFASRMPFGLKNENSKLFYIASNPAVILNYHYFETSIDKCTESQI
jgi:hypothetical protein